jgi:undecaprenyl diphosphate synthase
MCGNSDDLAAFESLLAKAVHEEPPVPPVDLLIRCGGEYRMSDLFGWECAYAELMFLPVLWPEFDETELRSAVEEFRRRERRFGALPAKANGK